MDRVIELEDTIRREVEDYAGSVYKAKTYFITDSKRHIYVVVVIPDHDHPTDTKPAVVVMARIVGNQVIIDEDITDRPLYEELLRCGIPREHIVLAYAGETLPQQSSEWT
jgi:hypothetical protein